METIGNDLIPKESIVIVSGALDFCKSVQSVEIKTNDQFVQASELFKQLGGHIKAIETEREKVKAPHLLKCREVDTWFKTPQNVLFGLKSKLDVAIRIFQKQQDDLRRVEQERLNREADEKRRKAEDAARAEREKAEELRRKAEQADKEERQKLIAQAQKAEAKADFKEQKAETIIAPIAQTAVPKVNGMSTRKNWKFECIDPIAFVKWGAEGGHWYLLMPNQITCNAHAKSIQQEIAVPGGRFYNDEILQSRG
jgi:hypothetical protein